MPFHLTRDREVQQSYQLTVTLRAWYAGVRNTDGNNPRTLTHEETNATPIKVGLRELQRTIDRATVDEEESLPSSPWSLSSENDKQFTDRIAFEDWFDKLKSCVETEEICPVFTTNMRLKHKRCPTCGMMRAPMCARRRDEDTCHWCAGHYANMKQNKQR